VAELEGLKLESAGRAAEGEPGLRVFEEELVGSSRGAQRGRREEEEEEDGEKGEEEDRALAEGHVWMQSCWKLIDWLAEGFTSLCQVCQNC
jgi:hypothetical protein